VGCMAEGVGSMKRPTMQTPAGSRRRVVPRQRDKNRLSTGDALFLFLEREGMPLNVASVSVFEGVISRQASIRFIESKLPFIPRYRQRVVAPPFNIGLPSWEFDPSFNVRNHVREITLEHGTEAELKAAAGKILGEVMDRRRPLWDLTLVHGLRGNRTGIVTRMHHCLADGLAGVGLMNVLMDQSPEGQPKLGKKARLKMPAHSEAPSLLDEVITSSVSVAEKVLSAQMELCNVVQQVLAAAGHGADSPKTPHPEPNGAHIPSVEEFARFMPEVTAATQPLPFNIICRGPQRFRWAEIPLPDIKEVKQACGVTLNDIALTLIASVFQRYSELRGVQVRGRLLRIVMPVSVRGDGSVSDLGNRITFVPITVPLDIRGVRKLVAEIHKRTRFLKSAHVGECVGLAGTLLGTIPTAAQELVGPIVSQVPLGLCNVIFTNVPGPASPLFMLGHKMLRCYPYVPIGGDLGINCALLTYNGVAYFGFSGNAQAAPDLGRLERFLIQSFAELRRALGIRPRRPRSVHPKANGHAAAVSAPLPEPPIAAERIPAKSVPAPMPIEQKETEPLASVGV